MNKETEITKKREFSKLPPSVITRALAASKNDVKEARAILRKYFGVFLTNKVLKGTDEHILEKHISSKDRDYEAFYERLFSNVTPIASVIDLGAGANGYSISKLRKTAGEVRYTGIEAAGQLVETTNNFFKEKKLANATMIQHDLFDTEKIKDILTTHKKPRMILLLQVIDALEGFKRDQTKILINEITNECEYLCISTSMRSIGGRKPFGAKRTWLITFLETQGTLIDNFEIGNERVFIINTKDKSTQKKKEP